MRKALAGAAVVSGLAISIISQWEGKSNKAYLDLVNVPTICYGETKNVRMGDVKSDSECTYLLHKEVRRLSDILVSTTPVVMTNNQRAAVISWMYNVGEGNFRRSTLRKKLMSGDNIGACKELLKWVYAGGKRVRGLENRRRAEYDLCMSND